MKSSMYAKSRNKSVLLSFVMLSILFRGIQSETLVIETNNNSTLKPTLSIDVFNENLYFRHFSLLISQNTLFTVIQRHTQISQALKQIQLLRKSNLQNVKSQLQSNYPSAWKIITQKCNGNQLPATQKPFCLISNINQLGQSLIPNAVALMKSGKTTQAMKQFQKLQKLRNLTKQLSYELNSQGFVRNRLSQIIEIDSQQNMANLLKPMTGQTQNNKTVAPNQSSPITNTDPNIKQLQILFGKQVVTRYFQLYPQTADKIQSINKISQQIQQWFELHPQVYSILPKTTALQQIVSDVSNQIAKNSQTFTQKTVIPYQDLIIANNFHLYSFKYINDDKNNITTDKIAKFASQAYANFQLKSKAVKLIQLKNQLFNTVSQFVGNYFYTEFYRTLVFKYGIDIYQSVPVDATCKPEDMRSVLEVEGKIYLGKKQVSWEELKKKLSQNKYQKQVQSSIINQILNGKNPNNKNVYKGNKDNKQWQKFLKQNELVEGELEKVAQKYIIRRNFYLSRGSQKIAICAHTIFILKQNGSTTLLIA